MKPMADDAASDSTSDTIGTPASGGTRGSLSTHQAGRLRRRSDFETVFRGGRVARGRVLRMTVRPNELRYHRVGLAVSTRVGNAVARNRVKRRLRAALRETLRPGHLTRTTDQPSNHTRSTVAEPTIAPGAASGMDIVVTALPSAAHVSYRELSADIERMLARLSISIPVHGSGGARA